MTKVILVSMISLAGLMISCTGNSGKNEKTVSETSLETEVPVEKKQFCFKNETPYSDGSGLVDVESLVYTVDGDAIKGKFEWIPAEKGGLSGEISGTQKGNVIEAVYNETYAEEPYPISLKITVSPDEAVITSSDESFGTYTIKKAACK